MGNVIVFMFDADRRSPSIYGSPNYRNYASIVKVTLHLAIVALS
jgi:hypothetical protein